MTLFPVLVDVYHKEQLVTKEEAEKIASDEREWRLRWGQRWRWRWEQRWRWRWVDVAVTKDASTAARIADILDKYGFNDVAKHIRGKCVYSRLCV